MDHASKIRSYGKRTVVLEACERFFLLAHSFIGSSGVGRSWYSVGGAANSGKFVAFVVVHLYQTTQSCQNCCYHQRDRIACCIILCSARDTSQCRAAAPASAFGRNRGSRAPSGHCFARHFNFVFLGSRCSFVALRGCAAEKITTHLLLFISFPWRMQPSWPKRRRRRLDRHHLHHHRSLDLEGEGEPTPLPLPLRRPSDAP